MSSIGPIRRIRHLGPFGGLALVAISLAGCGSDSTTKPQTLPRVTRITVAPDVAAIIVGAEVQYTAIARDSAGTIVTGRTIRWTTSDGSRARVSENGLVTGLADGGVRITATSEGAQGFADATVVTLPVASIDITPVAATIRAGRTQQLTARALSNTGQVLPGQRLITWSSSDASIVTVDAQGLVTARGTGAADITVVCEGRSALVRITVVP